MPDVETNLGIRGLKRIGGHIALDFANTVDWHASDNPHEWLDAYDDFLVWCEDSGILSSQELRDQAELMAADPSGARAAHEIIIQTREALYRIFTAIAHARRPSSGDLEFVNARLREAMAHVEIAANDNGYSWGWETETKSLERPLWPILHAAAELLTSDDLARVKQCADHRDGCGWLFVDMSRNRSRRWCSMSDCGNRAKVRRYYRRAREGQ